MGVGLELRRPYIIGVVHVGPLPGSPRYSGGFQEVLSEALDNAKKLEDGGVNAVIIENFYDAPYPKNKADEATIASMAIIVSEVVKALSIPVCVNILRNCGVDSVTVVAVAEASFIRVNALSQTIVGDQGIMEPISHELFQRMRYLNYYPEVFADVDVKHGMPLVKRPIKVVAREAVERGGARSIIVTGIATGSPPEVEDVRKVKESVEVPVLVGSGINPSNVCKYLAFADGAIVGTYFKEGRLISKSRVQKLIEALRKC